jgi:hypothetical protein
MFAEPPYKITYIPRYSEIFYRVNADKLIYTYHCRIKTIARKQRFTNGSTNSPRMKGKIIAFWFAWLVSLPFVLDEKNGKPSRECGL